MSTGHCPVMKVELTEIKQSCYTQHTCDQILLKFEKPLKSIIHNSITWCNSPPPPSF